VRHAATLCVAALLALSGCGFVNSGHRGSSKPDGFTLRGYVSVGAASAAPSASASPVAVSKAPGEGTCVAPAAANDVHVGSAVRVADPAGHTLGTGELWAGVRDATGGRCNFGFQITGVPGGVTQYVIGVGNHPPVTFQAHDLRSDKPAVIEVNV
jgi:hypothetical protein